MTITEKREKKNNSFFVEKELSVYISYDRRGKTIIIEEKQKKPI